VLMKSIPTKNKTRILECPNANVFDLIYLKVILIIKNKDEKIHNLEADKDRRIDSLEIMIHALAKRLELRDND